MVSSTAGQLSFLLIMLRLSSNEKHLRATLVIKRSFLVRVIAIPCSVYLRSKRNPKPIYLVIFIGANPRYSKYIR